MLPDTGERYLSTPLFADVAGRHERGGAGDLALDAERPAGRPDAEAADDDRLAAHQRRRTRAFAAVKHFYFTSRYGERRLEPGICRLHLRQSARDAARRASSRRSASGRCRTTRTGSPTRPARRSRRPFSPSGSAASSASHSSRRTSRSPPAPSPRSSVAFRLVLDAGDEAIFSEPAWFCYEPMLLAADAVPRKVRAEAAALRSRPRRDRRGDRTADAAGHRQHAAQSDRPHLRPRRR